MKCVVFIVPLFIMACGQGEGSGSAASKELAMAPSIVPEAAVSASSGPVTLTLSLRRRRFLSAEGLQFTIGLANNSNAPIAILDDAFVNGSRAIWPGGRSRTHIEIVDSNGRPIKIDFLPSDQTIYGVVDLNSLERETQEAVTRGLAAKKPALAPGEEISTPPWPDARTSDSRIARPANGYVSLPGDALGPGDYKIRAVYGHSPTKRLLDFYRKHRKEGVPPEFVTIATQFIGFTIER